MFNIGDYIIYTTQGVCQIDDICDKTYSDVTRTYYVLHPVRNPKLMINIPVENQNIKIMEIIHKDEAEEILESFKKPGVKWIEKTNIRPQVYSEIVKTGDRKEISKVANTLIRKKVENHRIGKKFCECDNKLLTSIQNTLFTELAISLNTTFEGVNEKITSLINKEDECVQL